MEYPKLNSNKVRVPSRDDYVTRPLLYVTIPHDINNLTAISDRTVLTVKSQMRHIHLLDWDTEVETN